MIASVFTLLSLGGVDAPPAPSYHAIAFVTDPLSHGTLGDGLLSLNEAIRLHNGTLLFPQLSQAEQNQVSVIPGTGGTTDVTWIEIDGEVTDTITIEQDLDTIVNAPYGLFIRGSGGTVTLDFTGAAVTRGMFATTSSLILQGLLFEGGPYGVEVQQGNATGGTGCTLIDVTFEDQTQFGVRVRGSQPGGTGRLILEKCNFVDVASAVEFDESLADRDTIFESRDVRITGADVGFAMTVGTGGTARFTFDRAVVESAVVGIELDAPSSNGRPLLVEGTHARIRAPLCVRLDTASDAFTWLQCRMWNLLAPNGTALEVGAVGDQVYGEMNEFRCVGDVTVATGGAPLPLSVRNMRCSDGAVTLSTSAVQAFEVRETRFVDCVTETAGTGAVAFDGSSFEGGSVGASSAAASMQLTGCYVANPGPGVAETQPLPAPQLGSMSFSPDNVTFGTAVQMQADLPNGLVCGFVIGVVPLNLPVLPPPFYVYFEPSAYLFLPGFYVAQQGTSWVVPVSPALFRANLVAQAVVLPLGGLQAPPLQLPPGWRFQVR